MNKIRRGFVYPYRTKREEKAMPWCVTCAKDVPKGQKFCDATCEADAAEIECSWCCEPCGEGGPKFSNLVKDFCSEQCWNDYKENEGFI